MLKRDNLIYMIGFNRRALEIDLADLTEEETMIRTADGPPHIRWLVGHLVQSVGGMARSLGAGNEQSEEYTQLFERGTELSDDPSVYPSFAQLREELFDLFDRAIAAAEKLSDEELDAELPPEAGFKATLMNAACFLCMHTFYHTGQITRIRRTLGRERPFG